jgi:hypothetical protein
VKSRACLLSTQSYFGVELEMSDLKQPSPNQAKKPHSMRGMCLTPWIRAYEATLAPAEIERFDERLAAAFEADKNCQLEQDSRSQRTGKSKGQG